MIVAIDGPSGAGKSTVAAMVAQKLDLQLIDTGAIYRGLTYLAQKRGIQLDDEDAIAALATDLDVDFQWKDGENRLMMNGQLLGDEIRVESVSKKTSQVAALGKVRAALLSIQRRLGRARSSILEGRDIGSVVFPDADVKIYLDASARVRAQRRVAQAAERGEFLEVDDVEKMIEERDARDRARDVAPLVCPDDALKIDATSMPIEDVVEKIISAVTQAD